jgi:hypothetical protein
MKRSHATAVMRRLDIRPRLTWLLAAFVAAAAISQSAWGDTHASTPRIAAKSPTVIHPPAHLDPGIKARPPAHAHLPMPVVHPPVQSGDTLIVPR